MKIRRDYNLRIIKLISLVSDTEDVYTNEQFTNSFYGGFLYYLENGVTMSSHWICVTGNYLRILLFRKKIPYSVKHIADFDEI
jgi:hypothetical protein